MRKLVFKMSMSIDGFVSGPNGEMNWIFGSMSEAGKTWVRDTAAGAGLHIMGSKTFDSMVSHWPFSDDQIATPMNDIPKAIFTKRTAAEQQKAVGAVTDPKVKADQPASVGKALDSWKNARIIGGDLAEQLKKLKAEDGGYILAQGGASFARNLIATGLVDEYRLVIHPVILGSGQPIFSNLKPVTDLELISSTTFASGVIAAVYRPKAAK